jgi:hypothetical protein
MKSIKLMKLSELMSTYEALQLLTSKLENDFVLAQQFRGQEVETERRKISAKKMKVADLTAEVLAELEKKLIGDV